MNYLTPAIMLTALASTSLQANAESPQPAPKLVQAPSVLLVSVLGDSRQALLKDKIRGDYVVVRVGQHLGRYRVAQIAANQIVLSSVAQPTQHYVLPRMPPSGPQAAAAAGVTAHSARRVSSSQPGPINPYPAAARPPAKLVPTNPYGSAKAPAVTTVLAPPGRRAGEKPVAAATTKTATVAKIATASNASTTTSTNKSAATPSSVRRANRARVETHTIRRPELQAALADFSALSKEIQLTRNGDTLKINGLARGSFFHRIGLRTGDVLVSVAGKRVRTVDDGAAVYATVLTAAAVDTVVLRGGKQITLRYRIVR